jgi:hypothetical protein
VVRVITMVAAEKTEGAVKGMGTAEATETVAAKMAAPARVMGIAAVIRAAETPGEVEDEVAGTVAVAVRATEVAAAKAVEAPEMVAVVRMLGTVAAAAKATAEVPAVTARGMGAPEVAPAKGPGTVTAAVVGAPEVAAKAVGALELAIIRVPGTVAAPAKSMEAEAALVPKAPGALEAQAVRPATTAAEKLGERRLQHPRQ